MRPPVLLSPEWGVERGRARKTGRRRAIRVRILSSGRMVGVGNVHARPGSATLDAELRACLADQWLELRGCYGSGGPTVLLGYRQKRLLAWPRTIRSKGQRPRVVPQLLDAPRPVSKPPMDTVHQWRQALRHSVRSLLDSIGHRCHAHRLPLVPRPSDRKARTLSRMRVRPDRKSEWPMPRVRPSRKNGAIGGAVRARTARAANPPIDSRAPLAPCGTRVTRRSVTCQAPDQCPGVIGSPWVGRRRKNRPTSMTARTTPRSQKTSTTACMVVWRWTSP